MKFKRFYGRWLTLSIGTAIALGIFFRLDNIEQRFYWYDEAFTSLRISGYTAAEFVEEVSEGRSVGLEELRKYQRPNPEKSTIDTIASLAAEEPQHPPLYFAIARFWLHIFGASVAILRGLSAWISLLILPGVYWLCRQLFNRSLPGWIAVALIAISPFHLLYAREAREYSLWMLITVLSGIALLRAIRFSTKSSWAIYGATVTIGLYTFPFFLLSALGHGIYAIAMERFKWSQTLAAYLLASLIGLLAFVPWLVVWVPRLPEAANDPNTAWMFERLSLPSLGIRWVGHISRLFLDWGFSSGSSLVPALLMVPPIILLVGYSLYFLYSRKPKRVWLFVLTSIAAPAIALIGHDLILGGRLSAIPRYLVPCYLGIHLAVAYLFAQKLSPENARISPNKKLSILLPNQELLVPPGMAALRLRDKLRCSSPKFWRQKLWNLAFIAVIVSGVGSCLILAQAKTWWHQSQLVNLAYIPKAIALAVNPATRPLIVVDLREDFAIGSVLSLSYLVASQVEFQFLSPGKLPKIGDRFSDVFLYLPSQELKNSLQKQNYRLQPVRIDSNQDIVLWKATVK